ncbi:tetratricopeptide repeat protein [Fulvivirga sediminis]|uniref:Tetratricopeptide repeat protein n=1 Tax=Fulvivirga sediminis TaxID=2803949 RepID=A0A937K1F9_9BACT|nr:tetratricopeptide repeat protein [Fulvivirga sediminis]MBL3657295.1 tetratricopeptide repeat protein [Fulvivirga sediminis]
MKRMILLLAAVSIAGYSFGQKKPKINQAEKAREEGNLGEAKEIIDAAIEHEKTKDDGKTWYYRGLIYASLDTTSNPQYQNLANDPLKEAMKAFDKAEELGGKSEYYISDANGLPILQSQQMQTLWGYYLNKGVEGYQAQESETAVKYFTKTQLVQPKDTTGYIYAGLAAQSGEDYETAAKNYYTLIDDLDYQSEDVYNSLIYIEGTINKDQEKALALVKKAKKAFPNNTDFAKSEINYLIQMGKIDEARNEIETAIANEPDNSNLYFTLGVMYEELDNRPKAIEAYAKSVELDPKNFNANFNLAVLYYNKAVDLIKQKNNLGITSEDRKKAKGMDADINQALKDAMPYWERVLDLEPNNRTALESLQYIYSQLKMNEKAVKVSEKLESMGDAE